MAIISDWVRNEVSTLSEDGVLIISLSFSDLPIVSARLTYHEDIDATLVESDKNAFVVKGQVSESRALSILHSQVNNRHEEQSQELIAGEKAVSVSSD